MHVGDAIARLREARAATQSRCAADANMSPQTWYRQESSARRQWTPPNAKGAMLALHALKPLTAHEMQFFADVWQFDPVSAIRVPSAAERFGRAMIDRFTRDPSITAAHVFAAARQILSAGVRPGLVYAHLLAIAGEQNVPWPDTDDEILAAVTTRSHHVADGVEWVITQYTPTGKPTPPPADAAPSGGTRAAPPSRRIVG